MSRWIRVAIVQAIAVLLLLTSSASAQHCHSLTGRWKLNPEKSVFGSTKTPDQQPEQAVVQITQGHERIRQDWEFQGSLIKGKETYEFATDGSESHPENAENSRQVPQTIRAEWQNCTLIVEDQSAVFGMFTLSTKSTYVMSRDGKELSILQESHNSFADSQRRLVYDLQE